MSQRDITKLSRNIEKYFLVREIDELASRMNFSLRGKKSEKSNLLAKLLLEEKVDRVNKFEDRYVPYDYTFLFSYDNGWAHPTITFLHPEYIKDEKLRDLLTRMANASAKAEKVTIIPLGAGDGNSYFDRNQFIYPNEDFSVVFGKIEENGIATGVQFIILDKNNNYMLFITDAKPNSPKEGQNYNVFPNLESYSGYPDDTFTNFYLDNFVFKN